VAIKRIELDVHNGLKNLVNSKREKLTIKQETKVTVSYKGFLIDLKVNALLEPPTDKYIGIIIDLPAKKEKYDDLISIGNQIFFKDKNIHSIF